MAYHRTSMATEPVRRYLLQIIAKSGAEPERLLPERDLAEKLHLSRVTVRRAIKELEDVNYIIRIPGRRGAFTNPAMSSNAEHAIGIVVSQNYIGQLFSLFLSGISERLYESGVHFCFSLYCKPDKSVQEIAFELENSGYDCLVWHTQSPEDLEVISLLQQHNFPVLTICNPNYPEWGTPEKRWYNFDFDDGGKIQASYFLQKKCKRVIYFGKNCNVMPSFQKELKEHGIRVDETSDFTQLKTFLDAGANGIYCQHDEALTKDLLFYISSRKDLAGVPILLPPRLMSTRYKEDFPHLNITLPDINYFRQQCVVLGKEVADGIANILEKKIITDKCVTIKGYKLQKNKK
ncbi:MAG: LacI family DNA-binding transcriptional regulator [Lentisphaeria bacterium]|nr:LacI family DNA-binding transcriptional regulator [Lentisphaeria bacterium]